MDLRINCHRFVLKPISQPRKADINIKITQDKQTTPSIEVDVVLSSAVLTLQLCFVYTTIDLGVFDINHGQIRTLISDDEICLSQK